MIALDTSSFVHYLAGSPGPDVEAVDIALVENQACLPPVVLSEILSDRRLPRALEEIVLQIPTLVGCRFLGTRGPVAGKGGRRRPQGEAR